MTADPRAMRGQADALRRAADRLTILRLRLANTVVDLSGAEDAATSRATSVPAATSALIQACACRSTPPVSRTRRTGRTRPARETGIAAG